MPLTRHEIQVEIEILGVTRDVLVEFNFIPGTPERGPSYASGGEPAEGPEVEILSASVFKPAFGGAAHAAKGVWVAGGEWLVDLLQDALHDGGLDIADFEDAYTDKMIATVEARAEMRAEDEAPMLVAAE